MQPLCLYSVLLNDLFSAKDLWQEKEGSEREVKHDLSREYLMYKRMYGWLDGWTNERQDVWVHK